MDSSNYGVLNPCHVRHLGCLADASCVVVLSPVILAAIYTVYIYNIDYHYHHHAMIPMTWLGKLQLWVEVTLYQSTCQR